MPSDKPGPNSDTIVALWEIKWHAPAALFWFGLGTVAGMVLMMVVVTDKHSYPTPDQLYGCTIKQQMPNGECP